MTKARQRERAKRRKEAMRRGEYEGRPFSLEPKFTDPSGRRWLDETEYRKDLIEREWLAARFGPKDEYSDAELDAAFNDPGLSALLDGEDDRPAI